MKPICLFGLGLMLFARISHYLGYCYLIVNHQFNCNLMFDQWKEPAVGGHFFAYSQYVTFIMFLYILSLKFCVC